MSAMSRGAALALAALGLLGGCWFGEPPLACRPCADDSDCLVDRGYRCVQGACSAQPGQCPTDGGPDDGGIDGGIDASLEVDAGPDAGGPDAGPALEYAPDRLAVGNGFGCTVTNDAEVHCWGRGEHARIGRTITEERQADPLPVDFPPGAPSCWAGVYAGQTFACAQSCDGQTWCWGDNRFGAVGQGTRSMEGDPGSPPARVDVPGTGGLTSYEQLCAGGGAICGRYATGDLDCWGAQCVIPNLSGDRLEPTVANQAGSEIACGHATMCAHRADGWACWGGFVYGTIPSPNYWDNLSDMAWPDRPWTPDLVPAPMTHLAFSSGRGCGVTDEDPPQVYCWGRLEYRQGTYTGLGGADDPGVTLENRDFPLELVEDAVEAGTTVLDLAVSQDAACLLVAHPDGRHEVRCWGAHLGSVVGEITDAQTAAFDDWIDLAAGFRSEPGTICALRANGDVYCTGAGTRSDTPATGGLTEIIRARGG